VVGPARRKKFDQNKDVMAIAEIANDEESTFKVDDEFTSGEDARNDTKAETTGTANETEQNS